MPTYPVPTGRKCFSFSVPDDPTWTGIFWGALYMLSVWASYKRDSSHTAALIAETWRQIIDDAYTGGTICVSDIQWRQQDDCLLQWSLDGGSTWTTIYDGSLCIAAKIEDGTIQGGSKTPQTGGTPNVCIDTFPAVDSRGAWQLPHLVSAGDTIEVTIPVTPQVWTDDIFNPTLYCADGTFWDITTGCGAGDPAHSGDPDLSANHMELLLAINGVFYRPLSGKVTVPGGVTNAPAFLLANDVLPSDNLGQITVKVEYCAVGYLHVFDFTVSDGGFRYPPSCIPTAQTTYHAGEGFSDSGSGTDAVILETPIVSGSIHLLRIRFVFANTWGGPHPNCYLEDSTCTTTICNDDSSGDTFVEFNCDHTDTSFIVVADQYDGGQQYFGTQRLKELWVYGAGSDPF